MASSNTYYPFDSEQKKFLIIESVHVRMQTQINDYLDHYQLLSMLLCARGSVHWNIRSFCQIRDRKMVPDKLALQPVSASTFGSSD